MKSFVNLVKNEFIKIFAQTAYKVFLIIMVVLFMLVPALLKGITALIDFADNFYTIEEDIEYYQASLEESDEELYKEYVKIEIESLELFSKNGMGYDSWQYSSMYADYLSICMAEHIYGLLKNGEVTLEEAQDSYFSSYLYDEVAEEEYGIVYEELSAERKEYEDLILNSEISDFYNKLYNDISETKSQYENYLGQLKANALYNDEYAYEAMIFEAAIEACTYSQSTFKILIDEKVEYDSWKYNSAILAQSTVVGITYTEPPITLNEFNDDSYYYEIYGNYDEYLSEWKNDLNDRLMVTKVLEYSVKNNVPTQSVKGVSSSKNTYILTLTSNIELLMYFAVVLAGLIVANEFSSGTARLLFVRPHSRNKILLSKYATILLLVFGLNIANLFISFIYTILFNGVGDIFAPNLVIDNGVIKEASLLLNILGTVVFSNFRVVFIVSLAFMMSTLCKKGALGIVVGIVADTLISSIYSIIILATDFSILKFTPLPYYMMEIFSSSQVEYLISIQNGIGVGLNTSSMYYPMTEQLSVLGGIANYAVWIGACLIATFLPFRKQEIKN